MTAQDNKKRLFDIGANVGAYAQARWDTGEYAKLICIDANEVAFGRLETRFENNPNVIAINAAVGAEDDKTLKFYQTQATVLSTVNPDWLNTPGFRFHGNQAAHIIKEIEIQQVTLDKLIRIYGVPDLIKIDVVGYEETVVKGLTQKTPELCFEWVEEMEQACIRTVAYLSKLGFKEYAIQHEDDYVYAPHDYRSIREFNLSDLHTVKDDWGMVWVR